MKQSTLPRNQRNKNPLNIEKGDDWEGLSLLQLDPRFATFVDGVHGFRAGAKILASYARRGIVTLEDIISTWAPPSENDTQGYIKFVSERIHAEPYETIEQSDYGELMYAMHIKEGGGFTLEEALQGAALALIPDYEYKAAA